MFGGIMLAAITIVMISVSLAMFFKATNEQSVPGLVASIFGVAASIFSCVLAIDILGATNEETTAKILYRSGESPTVWVVSDDKVKPVELSVSNWDEAKVGDEVRIVSKRGLATAQVFNDIALAKE